MNNNEQARLLASYLQQLSRYGLSSLPKPQPMAEQLVERSSDIDAGQSASQPSSIVSRVDSPAPEQRVSSPHVALQPQSVTSAPAARAAEAGGAVVSDPAAALAILQQQVSGCTRCTELACTRTQTVFGTGNPQPRLVFLGEAPGAEEDRQGVPFIGAAGQLLDRILQAATLRREEVYILNVLKCRPPGNRPPKEPEVENCFGYAREQLAILKPEFICCLGSVAARALLGTKKSLGSLRQQFFQVDSSRVIVTYHPAYLLRYPQAKRMVWDDIKMLMAEMGISP